MSESAKLFHGMFCTDMKPRAEWLNDILMSTKPSRHQDKRKKQKHKDRSEEAQAKKDRKRAIQKMREYEAADYDEY